MDQIIGIGIPFLIALFQVLTAAAVLGILPALWILIRRGEFGRLWKWLLAALICGAIAAWLPFRLASWKEEAGKDFKPAASWVGYFFGALFIPLLITEPFRAAKRRQRGGDSERGDNGSKRRKRRKRRTHQMPGPTDLR